MRNHRAIVLGCVVVICAAVAGCSPGGTTSRQSTTPTTTGSQAKASAQAPAWADGISFVKDGSLQFVTEGTVQPVSAADKLQAVGRASDAGGIVVMSVSGASDGQVTWYPTASAKPMQLWRPDAPGNLGSVRYIKGIDSVWFSIYGSPDAVLKSASPPAGKQVVHTLDPGFNGEFDVDAKGETLVSVGKGQNPSSIMLRDAEGSNAIPLTLPLMFSPDLSVDGSRLCFVGGKKASDLSVWVYDLQGAEPRELEQTRGLGPTVPVFSADGNRVAFRSANDGVLWVVDVKQGEPIRLPFTADEGPIGW